MEYNVDYFIKKFEAIPGTLWCVFTADNGKGQHCAWGHIDSGHNASSEMVAFYKLDEVCMRVLILTPSSPNYVTSNNGFANINNGGYYEYQQPTPKQRIIAALYDIKKMQHGHDVQDNVHVTKTIIKYVSVPESITESLPETILS